MRALTSSTIVLCVLFSGACSAPEPPAPPPPKATVFDPLTQQMERARAVQKTVDEHAAQTRESVDTQERGDTPPP